MLTLQIIIVDRGVYSDNQVIDPETGIYPIS